MIKKTNSPIVIKEKLMIWGAFIFATAAALAMGADQYAPLAGFAGLAAAVFFILKREQKKRRVEGE